MEEKFVSIFPYNGNQYLHNIAFDSKKNKGIERTIFLKLRDFLKKRNIILNTYDVEISNPVYRYVYYDLPYPWNFKAWKKIITNRQKNILISFEPPVIIPFNYMKIFHLFFVKVYTWHEVMVDDKKYFKILWPQSSSGIGTRPKKFNKKKFLVFINKNTSPFLPFKLLSSFGMELYSERIRAISFFESKIPNKFSLYGRGWNKQKKYSYLQKDHLN